MRLLFDAMLIWGVLTVFAIAFVSLVRGVWFQRVNKGLKLSMGLAFAAFSLMLCPQMRSFASQEGSYIYHELGVNGPVYLNPGPSQQITIAGVNRNEVAGVYIGSSTTGGFTIGFKGAFAVMPSTHNVGDFYYDTNNGTLVMSTAAQVSTTAVTAPPYGWIEISTWTGIFARPTQ